MEDKKISGYIEQSHTADWALKVWAPDYFELIRQAAQGMYALMEARFEPSPALPMDFRVTGDDRESLLVQFLNELLYFYEQNRLGLDHFVFALEGNSLLVDAVSRPVTSINKEIKAVTYHHLSIEQVADRLETGIVFDV